LQCSHEHVARIEKFACDFGELKNRYNLYRSCNERFLEVAQNDTSTSSGAEEGAPSYVKKVYG